MVGVITATTRGVRGAPSNLRHAQKGLRSTVRRMNTMAVPTFYRPRRGDLAGVGTKRHLGPELIAVCSRYPPLTEQRA
jgi:hypothetical protein